MSASDKVIGSISETLNTGEFEWRMHNCYGKIFEVGNGKYLDSPTFTLLSSSWCIRIYPNGFDSSCKEWISLFLHKKESKAKKYVSYSLVMSFQGIQLQKKNDASLFENILTWGWTKYILRKEVLDHWSEETKNCNQQLTIKITLRDPVSHDEDALPKVRTKGKQILCQNYKDLLLHSEDHDLFLKVKDKEFKVHRHIMQFRCPVFKSMLSHDMLEKNEGVVEIPDCDPLAFEQFLLHVYAGEVEVLDKSTMLGLYFIADKYDMENLKEECSAFIKESLTADVVCDVIKLALNHSDSVLLEFATKYFLDNTEKILVTVEWQTFMKENTIQANELFIKAFNKNSCCCVHSLKNGANNMEVV